MEAPEKTIKLEEAKRKFLHVSNYLKELVKKNIRPEFVAEPTRDMGDMSNPNIIYPVGDPIFIHIYKKEGEIKYNVIEPELNDTEKDLYEKIINNLIDVAYKEDVPDNVLEIGEVLVKLLDLTVHVGKHKKDFVSSLSPKISLTKKQYENIKYFLIRDRVGYGKLEPLFYDSFLEDIHCTGVGSIKTIHKIFGMVYTTIIFKDDNELNKYIIEVTERVERPASDTRSIVDAVMPDGSRSNFIFGNDVSLEGSSFTIRKFSKTPISVTQLINWGTLSCELAAYLWIAIENGMNLFICGETASGKTTTLNAIAAFIKPDAKIYTVENTHEVTMPHEVWQHLVTRESGKESDVTYLDLLVAALRSRPNYIIVGEIRGEEGSIAFQGMQTGHPVMSTFHAGNVRTMIQRITGDPINVPITFVDNLNLCLIQQAVFRNNKFVRRVLSLSELERYYEPSKKMITREVFTWDAVGDNHQFRGLFNSYILEQKIARVLGYENTRKIYSDMEQRAKILQRMIEENIFNYFDVWKVIKAFKYGGVDALPFKI